MFKLFAVVFAAILAIAAAKPGIVSAPLAYSAGVAPVAYSSPLVRSVAAPLAYSAGYASPYAGYPYASPYAYSAGLVSPYVY